MVLDHELSRHRRTKTERKRRRVLEFLIREGSYRNGRRVAVLRQELGGGRLRHLRIVLLMFAIHLGDDFPRDILNGPTTGDCPARSISIGYMLATW